MSTQPLTKQQKQRSLQGQNKQQRQYQQHVQNVQNDEGNGFVESKKFNGTNIDYNSTNQKTQKKSLKVFLKYLEVTLNKQIIEPFQAESQDFQRQLVNKLSEQARYDLQETYRDISDLESKLQNPILTAQSREQIKQSILVQRMNEIAYHKVLVHTYKHHQYRLVIAHFHMATSYQQLACHQQAVNHLTLAIQLNQKYLSSVYAHYYHTFLLTSLADSIFNLDQPQKSLEYLNKALEIQEQISEQQENFNDFWTVSLISKVLLSLGQMEEAMSYGKMCLISAEKIYGKESVEMANALKSIAEVQVQLQKFKESLEHIQQAIRTLKVFSPEKQNLIIEFYGKMTSIQLKRIQSENLESHDLYINCLKNKYQAMEDAFGYRDKRCIKQKRLLASALLKYSKIDEAQEQLQDILEIEETVYGQKSVEVGKTLKLLGTISMSKNELKKGQKFLKKSQGIFHDQGFTNLEREVQQKLLILNGEAKFNKSHKY